jgi:hypothetical protein
MRQVYLIRILKKGTVPLGRVSDPGSVPPVTSSMMWVPNRSGQQPCMRFRGGLVMLLKLHELDHEETPMCGILTFVEELSLKEDLAVSDGDDIGGNVGRHVTSLRTHETVQNRVKLTTT